MSFFGGGGDDQAKLAQAKMEMEGMNEMFNKMSHMCFTKCVARHNEAEMTVGEMSCVDRCVGKVRACARRARAPRARDSRSRDGTSHAQSAPGLSFAVSARARAGRRGIAARRGGHEKATGASPATMSSNSRHRRILTKKQGIIK